MRTWLSMLWPILAALLSGLLGWNLKDVELAGSASTSNVAGIGVASLGGGVTLLLALMAAWKQAGGKLDGKLTVDEFEALGNVVAPNRKETVKRIAPAASSLVNALLDFMRQKSGLSLLPKEVKLENGQVVQVAAVPTMAVPDEQHRMLLWASLDLVTQAVTGDVAGEKAAYDLRKRLHDLTLNQTAYLTAEANQTLTVPAS